MLYPVLIIILILNLHIDVFAKIPRLSLASKLLGVHTVCQRSFSLR